MDILVLKLNEAKQLNSRFLWDDTSASSAAAIEAQRAYIQHIYDLLYLLQIEVMAAYLICFALSLLLIVYLRINKASAYGGNESAAKKIVLPAFEPLMWMIAFSSAGYSIYTIIVVQSKVYRNGLTALNGEIFHSGRVFILFLPMVLMFQKSMSPQAIRRAGILAASVGLAGLLISFTLDQTVDPGSSIVSGINYAWRALCSSFFFYAMIFPPPRASKISLYSYCLFSIVYYAVQCAYRYYMSHYEYDIGLKVVLVNSLMWACAPIYIWFLIKADTEHWRGLGMRACTLQKIFCSQKKMSEIVSSDGLHVLIEMNRKHIIDFAYLHVNKPIGSGAKSTVYRGMLHSKTPVAIKVYTPNIISEEEIAEYSNEAALCSALKHPNIVDFYGLCVSPPNICLVSQLCHASLEDVLHTTCQKQEYMPARIQLNLALAYMLDAARSVAFLHSFSPAFIHRDIKSANFLIADNGFLKLTDFGESRSLPGMDQVELDIQEDTMHLNGGDLLTPTGATSWNSLSQELLKPESTRRMSVRGTLDYMAPELMRGKAGFAQYGQAADIYSLAITMWEILHPGEDKYPKNGNHLKIYDWVIQGRRPIMNEKVPLILRQLIENSWNDDVSLRPSARDIVNILEEIQIELSASFAARAIPEMLLHDVYSKTGKTLQNVISGEACVDFLKDSDYVETTSEAIRIGNALMDSGLLHHIRHEMPFADTQSNYFFDMNLLVESSIPEETNDTEETRLSDCGEFKLHKKGNGSNRTYLSSAFSSITSILQLRLNSKCACQKLSQDCDFRKFNKKLHKKKKDSKKISNDTLTSKLFLQNDTEFTNEFEEYDHDIHRQDSFTCPIVAVEDPGDSLLTPN